jgi:succinylglutamate desuccinylase
MKNFEPTWQTFTETGNFLELSRQWQDGTDKPRQFTLADGTQLKLEDTGLLIITPSSPSTTSLLISSGIHGNETAPMEIVDGMVRDICSGQLKVRVNLMLIIGDPPAVNIGQRFQVQNLNRLFSKRYQSAATESGEIDYEMQRAKQIEQAVESFYQDSDEKRFHFDLHTAIRPSQYEQFVLYPYMHNKPWDKEHIGFFGGSGITTVLLGNQPAGTFSYYTSNQFDAMAATVELGKVRPFGENDMKKFAGTDNNLRCLIEATDPKVLPFNNDDYIVFQIKQEIIKANDDFNLLLDDDVKNFTSFKKGTLLASDGKDEKYVVENDGEAIVFPNNKVPIGQRVGVLLESIEL